MTDKNALFSAGMLSSGNAYAIYVNRSVTSAELLVLIDKLQADLAILRKDDAEAAP